MSKTQNSPLDLFDRSPVRSFEPYKFVPYAPGERKAFNARGPSGKTRRLSTLESTKEMDTASATLAGTDPETTVTAKCRAPKPSPEPILTQLGSGEAMLGVNGREAVRQGDEWFLWLREYLVFTQATYTQACTWATRGYIDP